MIQFTLAFFPLMFYLEGKGEEKALKLLIGGYGGYGMTRLSIFQRNRL
jgi:hypothetical protein